MVSDTIDNIKSNKGDNWRRRLAAETQFLEVMVREGCEGYAKFKKEGDYAWALDDSLSDGGKKLPSKGNKGGGSTVSAGTAEDDKTSATGSRSGPAKRGSAKGGQSKSK